MLRADQSAADGQTIAEDLMARLGVGEKDLQECAYMDLLERGETVLSE